MFRHKFGASGSYKVQEIELIHQPKSTMRASMPVVVRFLDDSSYTFHIDKHAKGQVLLNLITDHLDLVEPDYFGLQFCDPDYEAGSVDVWRWLETHKSIRKQVRTGSPYTLYFRVKFFVSDPCVLQDEYTRYNFFLQLRKDIQEGRMGIPDSVAPLLASYVVQSELGDFAPDAHPPGYLGDHTFMPNQKPGFDVKVHELHKLHAGQTPADSEYRFLDQCRHLPTYGINLYDAKDANGVDIQLGVTFDGLVVFQNALRLNLFTWGKIIKISFKQKQFFIQLHEDGKDYDTLLGFYMLSYRTCKNLWKSCVEHHSFFRLRSTKPLVSKKYSLFSFGSKFRYSGRTEYETLEDGKRRFRSVEKNHISRSPSKRYARRTVAGSSRDQILEEKPSTHREKPVPPSVHSAQNLNKITNSYPIHHASDSTNHLTIIHVNANGLLDDGNLNNGAPCKSPAGNGAYLPNIIQPTLLYQSNVKKGAPVVEALKIDDEGGFREPHFNNRSSQNSKLTSNHVRLENADGNRHPINGISYRAMPEKNYEQQQHQSLSSPPAQAHVVPVTVNRHVHSRKEVIIPSTESNGNVNGLVCIRIKPDVDGKFGFNVRGGVDLHLPVIVTRVAHNTPADLTVPRLNEGDQVLKINGRDTDNLLHEEVVKLIKSSRDTKSGELLLHVRPNVYNGEEMDEPEFQYIPDSCARSLSGSNLLQESILLLSESLKTGNALVQFEQLHRKNPKMTMKDSEMVHNTPKNRYKDVLPYDSTRVRINSENGNDYINANFINMEIPSSGIVNRYIAAQGPLPHTSPDFWQMVWEQQSTLVVMLTSLVEQGRIKCHQYWPSLHEAAEYGSLQVTCVKEQAKECFAFREFSLINLETREERHITHMQYIAWPDHGVPEDASDFLDFVIRVRQHRVGMVEPAVIHCSAGIGRTGVLILMETAMCLMEANEPIYPSDVVRTMRDQRGMLIQTTSQYKFVCEAILRVFNDGLVKPLEDYNR